MHGVWHVLVRRLAGHALLFSLFLFEQMTNLEGAPHLLSQTKARSEIVVSPRKGFYFEPTGLRRNRKQGQSGHQQVVVAIII